MTLQLNGVSHEILSSMSVADLLGSIGLEGRPVVVEINEEAVFPRDYPQLMVCEGDRVEVVMLAAGG